MSGAGDLARWLEEYCSLGIHRVATAVDRRTLEWFADALSGLGATAVERRPFSVDRYAVSTRVEVDGVDVEADSLYYEGVGTVRTDSPRVAVMAAMGPNAATSPGLVAEIERARAEGAEVLLVATEHPDGLLQVPNRVPVPGSGLPVVLVAGRHADELRAGGARVELDAAIEPADSANIVARFGDTSRRPILLATPLSGWFTCAAERGTGIAVLFDVIERIAVDHPVVVVGTSAHELFFNGAPTPNRPYGLWAYLDHFDVDPALIVHCGANVALAAPDDTTGNLRLAPGLDDPQRLPAAGRGLFARYDDDSFERVLDEFDAIDMTPIRNPPRLSGEAQLWGTASRAPIISFVGITPYFHTPQDTPDNTTTPAALVTVADTIVNAITAFTSQQ